MTDHLCCPGGDCDPGHSVSRRRFLTVSAGTAAGLMLTSRAAAAAQLGVLEDDLVLVPAGKGLSKEWIRSLYRRGTPSAYTGDDLRFIGMPVGGGCTGQLYLGGDGRLWNWDVFNTPARGTSDVTYATPRTPASPFRQGFALRTTTGGRTRHRTLDAGGFDDVRFTGQYPIGQVDYRADDVHVRLEAFSPFVPLATGDSTLPATVLVYTLQNTGDERVDAELLGWLENPVCLDSRTQQPIVLTAGAVPNGLQFSARDGHAPAPRPPIEFEDFENETYEGWTVEGTAFGTGPVSIDEVPDYMKRFGDLGVHGTRFVTSHQFRGGEDVGQADAHLGKLTSRPFSIERRYINVAVGGGSHAGTTCVNVVVDGAVVASVAGPDAEPMAPRSLDVAHHEGKTAVIEIVDAEQGGWGHINCDHIVFSDEPAAPRPFTELPDAGTIALTVVGEQARVRPSIERWDSTEDLFTSGPGPEELDAGLGTLAGAVSVRVSLRPGESRTVRFVLGWYFPIPDRASLAFLRDAATLKRHYAGRFGSAAAVADHVGRDLARLERDTRLWVDTWYTDSSLPHWLLERTFATASTIATSTCYRFDGGRFYGWEGVYCCAGTCEHVWNYAQSIARLFPELERDTRQRVDLGIGFHPDTGQIGNRAEADMGWATDGQCGTILRFYREHTMAPDGEFLAANWPRLRKALEWVIAQDGGRDGTLEGPQPNTLDQTWYGEISWITSMYVAALRAGAALAGEVGDTGFAAQCARLADAGSAFLASTLWTGEYFVQRVDPAHADVINHNRGCHIDQMFGQSLALQYGLGRVMPAEQCTTALEKLYRYNFAPDPAAYRDEFTEIEGGRWFAMAHEPGMLMTTWPHGGAEDAPGDPASWAAIYFNECWTGQEYQVASHMIAEGLLEKGLILTRAVHDRYHPAKRNPYNEIECGDHYARAMAGYGVFTAICGFEHHGPRGHLGFAPRISPSDFRAAFTAAEGWGLYRQQRLPRRQECGVELRYGRLRVSSLAFEVEGTVTSVRVRLAGRDQELSRVSGAGGRVDITLARPVIVTGGETLTVTVTTA